MRMRLLRILALLLLAVMLPGALAAGGFQAVVIRDSMKVYARGGGHELLGTLPKGTEVTVVEYSGKAALISWKGKTGLARVGDMMALPSGSSESAAVETVEASSEPVRTMVTAASARVYRRASTAAKSVKIGAGVTVKVLATSNGWAKVKRGSTVGYMKLGALTEPGTETAATQVAEPETTPAQQYERREMVTTAACRVYAKPDASGPYVIMEKGATLTVLAIKDGVAMVEQGGNTGYMDAGKLAEKPAGSAVSTAEGHAGVDTSKYSNEQIIYYFLVKEVGYSTAAACGVVANIKYESGFKPTSNGDGGTSYGIAQWHAGRKTRLINWCGSNGYDYNSLEGQLYYLKHELKTYYPAVHNYLKGVENSAQGAYEAGYYFCYHFEAPASRESRSVTRGNYAKDTLWNRYKT